MRHIKKGVKSSPPKNKKMTLTNPNIYTLRRRTQSMLADQYTKIPQPKASENVLSALSRAHNVPERILQEYFLNQFLECERKIVKRKVRINMRAVSAYRAYRSAKISSLKKMASVCARELRRALMRTGKTNPCLKGRRSGKGFNTLTRGKKMKKRGEREKKKEDRREEEREQRKLNYLIDQTELYAHFVLRGEHERLRRAKVECTDDEGMMKEVGEQLEKFKQEDKSTRANDDGITNIKNTTRTQSVPTLRHFKANLKEYQAKGVCWLINLYNQGINGILADDMGLGKTVQTLAFLTYLAEHHNKRLFLIVTPASTLHNWETEIKRFNPDFKVNLYIGSDRNVSVRRIPHPVIVLTSYQLISDRKLKRIKYDYLVCDEAQAIKSNKSRRWKNINELRCNNRLLLTGTPIQNSMQELWSLLHFIMPGLFDSHTLFLSWFSNEKSVKKEGLERLHSILKPFMLRREKKDVKNELGTKTEKDVICTMTPLQHALYERVNKENESENMMMQLRKIVNHPELFMHRENGTGLYCARDQQVLHLNRRIKSMYRRCLGEMLDEIRTVNAMYRDIRGMHSKDDTYPNTNHSANVNTCPDTNNSTSVDTYPNIDTTTQSKNRSVHSHPVGMNYQFVGRKKNGVVTGSAYDSYVENMSVKSTGVGGNSGDTVHNSTNYRTIADSDTNIPCHADVNNSTNSIPTSTPNTVFTTNTHITGSIAVKRKIRQENNRGILKRAHIPDYSDSCAYNIRESNSTYMTREYTRSDVRLNFLEEFKTRSSLHDNRSMIERINGTSNKRFKCNKKNDDFYYIMGATGEIVDEHQYYEKECSRDREKGTGCSAGKSTGRAVDRGIGRNGVKSKDIGEKKDAKDANEEDDGKRIRIPTCSLMDDSRYYGNKNGMDKDGEKGSSSNVKDENENQSTIAIMNEKCKRVKTINDQETINTMDDGDGCRQIINIRRSAGRGRYANNGDIMSTVFEDIYYEKYMFLKQNILAFTQQLYFKGIIGNLVEKAFCNVYHNNYVAIPEIDLVKESGKLVVLDSMLKKMEGRRVLIYFQMTKMIDLFEQYVKMNNFSYVRLDGGVKVSERKKIVNTFQTEDIFLFLLSTRAGGLGINLTKANTVIFYDSDWNPTVDQQAMDRAYRLGNTEDVVVYRLVTANSVEEKMRITAGMKEEIHRLVIDGGEFTL